MSKSNYIYLYDGSFINLLNLIKILLKKKIIPQNIKDDTYLPNLLEQSFKFKIEDDEKVIQEIINGTSKNILTTIYYLFLSNEENKELLIYYFLVHSLKFKNKVYYMRNLKSVDKALKVVMYVSHENHKFKGFVRFKELANNILYAEISPVNNILPILSNYFKKRLKNEFFIIKDVKRNIVSVYDKKDFYILDGEEFKLIGNKESSSEKLIQDMWIAFYKTIGIKERKNDRCRRNFMPKKYWKNIIEMRDEL